MKIYLMIELIKILNSDKIRKKINIIINNVNNHKILKNKFKKIIN